MCLYSIENLDIIEWARSYTGPKFHALLSDPSYALSKKKRIRLDEIAKLPSKPTNAQVIAAYHALQQWGDTGFMGKAWDTDIAFNPETWVALAEHLYPGAFGMAFASSKGWHRLAIAIEDAGMIIQPSIFGWATGQGIPKATRVDIQIDKRAGKLGEREIIGSKLGQPGYSLADNGCMNQIYDNLHSPEGKCNITAPATDLARIWVGYRYGGQILRNLLEPIIVFQKPWEGKRLDCMIETGAGALWVDGGRIGAGEDYQRNCNRNEVESHWRLNSSPRKSVQAHPQGRWPANFTLTHHPDCQQVGAQRVKGHSNKVSPSISGPSLARNIKGGYGYTKASKVVGYADSDGYETIIAWDCIPECPIRRLGEISRDRMHGAGHKRDGTQANVAESYNASAYMMPSDRKMHRFGDTGTAARFYFQADWSYEIAMQLARADPVMYCAKTSRVERESGLLGLFPCLKCGGLDTKTHLNKQSKSVPCRRCNHPTVKPIALTNWLATLLLPPVEYLPRRLVVPFGGTNSEGIGALLAGWDEVVMIDSNPEYCQIAKAKTEYWLDKRQLELSL